MRKKTKICLCKYGITGGICALTAVFYCRSRNLFQVETLEKYRILCDAFTVPGLICLCVGVLIWASNDGIFYGIRYCLHVAWRGLIPGGRYQTERYYDYVTEQKEKRVSGYGFLFLWGIICLTFSLIFLLLFYG